MFVTARSPAPHLIKFSFTVLHLAKLHGRVFLLDGFLIGVRCYTAPELSVGIRSLDLPLGDFRHHALYGGHLDRVPDHLIVPRFVLCHIELPVCDCALEVCDRFRPGWFNDQGHHGGTTLDCRFRKVELLPRSQGWWRSGMRPARR